MHPKRLVILYGSQTGNAQDAAERIAREASRRSVPTVCMSMSAYDLTQLPDEAFVVFVVATTGQGEPPANMRNAWRLLLRKSLPPSLLTRVHYAVFGLGDSGYVQYNVMAKKLDRRLAALGANALLPRGLGDDQARGGYEAALDPWLQELWSALGNHVALSPIPTMPDNNAPPLAPPPLTCTWLDTPPHTISSGATPTTVDTDLQPGDVEYGWSVQEEVHVRVAVLGVLHTAQGGGTQAAPATPTQATPAAAGTSEACPLRATLKSHTRITAADHFQDTRHVVLDAPGISYQAGDILHVLPRQPAANIHALLRHMGWTWDTWVCIQAHATQTDSHAPVETQTHTETHTPVETHTGKNNSNHQDSTTNTNNNHANSTPITTTPTTTTSTTATAIARIGPLIASCMDLSSCSPRRFFFEVMSHYAAAVHEQERLLYFGSAEGRDDLYQYNQREGRTLLEVLTVDFRSTRPPLSWLLWAGPRLQSRAFSIASSPTVHAGEVHLTVAVVEWVTPYKRTRQGLCSTWLASLPPNTSLYVWVEQGTMHMPSNPHIPLIMVGPGTGVAPFRSMLHTRAHMMHMCNHDGNMSEVNHDARTSHGGAMDGVVATTPAPPPAAVAPSVLFFGCRNEHGDYYYRHEWEHPHMQRVLMDGHVRTAFSRDGPSKVYVQQRIREQGALLWRLLDGEGAHVYVCGSASNMPQAVASAFRDIVQQHGGMTADEAAVYVRQLELRGRYKVEAWS